MTILSPLLWRPPRRFSDIKDNSFVAKEKLTCIFTILVRYVICCTIGQLVSVKQALFFILWEFATSEETDLQICIQKKTPLLI